MDSCTIHGEPITNTLSGMSGTPLRSAEDRAADAAERQAAAWERIATAAEVVAMVVRKYFEANGG